MEKYIFNKEAYQEKQEKLETIEQQVFDVFIENQMTCGDIISLLEDMKLTIDNFSRKMVIIRLPKED